MTKQMIVDYVRTLNYADALRLAKNWSIIVDNNQCYIKSPHDGSLHPCDAVPTTLTFVRFRAALEIMHQRQMLIDSTALAVNVGSAVSTFTRDAQIEPALPSATQDHI